MYTILGAGLAGISASYHLGHQNSVIFEKNSYAGGHIHSEQINGFTWDEGPHVSFTKHPYVKQLFAESLKNEFLEYHVYPVNYYKGSWVPHPAQSNLYAVPEPLRSNLLANFLNSRQDQPTEKEPDNYQEWLEMAFGKTFSEVFPAAYTKKYWTIPPTLLTTEWVGNRVFFPDIETVKKGFEGPQKDSTHYISEVRYPKNGGYMSYTKEMLKEANISFNKEITAIDLANKVIKFSDGEIHQYKKLISTLPLPQFIRYCNAPSAILEAAEQLSCSQLLLINVEVNHLAQRDEHWLYVYDEDKYATRINFTDLLSPNNAPEGKCGIQVEVYFSKFNPKNKPDEFYAKKVLEELIKMGLIKSKNDINNYHTKWIPFANVIFDHPYSKALATIFKWLENYGLLREKDDLHPMTNWDIKMNETINFGDIILAGRFGQWKYYWTDDCVLRGVKISI